MDTEQKTTPTLLSPAELKEIEEGTLCLYNHWKTDKCFLNESAIHQNAPNIFDLYDDIDRLLSHSKALEARVKELESILDDVEYEKGIIGKLIRENDSLKESEYKHNGWIRCAKEDAGYFDGISFDIVWKEVLEKAKQFDALTPQKGSPQ